ncbi:hypothetical protein M0802_009410 [Mischocyttarus mexicanus]|nr:hypothetical protein M0802_009410 [Mischocyttarus mexicanus]
MDMDMDMDMAALGINTKVHLKKMNMDHLSFVPSFLRSFDSTLEDRFLDEALKFDGPSRGTSMTTTPMTTTTTTTLTQERRHDYDEEEEGEEDALAYTGTSLFRTSLCGLNAFLKLGIS